MSAGAVLAPSKHAANQAQVRLAAKGQGHLPVAAHFLGQQVNFFLERHCASAHSFKRLNH